jgi:acetyl-CoA acetyltransferase
MSTTIKDQTAIVGVGATPYYRRGESLPQSTMEMGCTAIIAACDDAGLSVDDIDGFSVYAGSVDPAAVAQVLGIPEIRWATTTTSGGGGASGCVGVGAAAITTGMATTVVSLMTLQQAKWRIGGTSDARPDARSGGGSVYGNQGVSPEAGFTVPYGLAAPGHNFSFLAQRHMAKYGTTREHFAEVVISQRDNASRRETAIKREPLSLDDYFNARMISEPLCLLDYTLETDGAVAVITTSADRARDLRQRPVYVMGSAHGGSGRWGQFAGWFQMPDDIFASSGHRPVARRAYEMAGITPADVDVALLYDHFSPMVLMQLEDYGFCAVGESGPFVAEGNIRWKTGTIPVNTHGGNLSEAYIIGMTHIREAVEQLRGVAVIQVDGAEIALTTGGPAALPVSCLLLRC